MNRSGDSTHSCWSTTPIACDLAPPTRTKRSEEEYNDLTASNRRLSTSFSATLSDPQPAWVTRRGEELSERGPKFLKIFELCPIILIDVQYIFPWGASPP